jgi:hypothetical protein
LNLPDTAALRKLRQYAEPFAAWQPPIFEFFPGGKSPLFPFLPESDRGLGMLLFQAALYRPGAENWSAQVLAGLYRVLGTDLFKVNRLPFAVLQKALTGLPRWPDPEEQRRVPGILRSVCDFFYGAGGLGKWLESSADWETRARELGEGIFWMGKRSRLRTKARYFFWLASFQGGFAERFPQAQPFLWPVAEGHLRLYHGVLRPRARKSFSNPEEKLRWFHALGNELFPRQGWRLYQPLQAHLRPDPEHGFQCRAFGGCRPCALAAICPAANQFLPKEPRA